MDGKISTKSPVASVDAGFADFVRRIRAGDDQAAAELVNRFESLIRREVRLRISGNQVNRAFDSVDVSQSVLANFFVRAATGQFELEHPDQLARLLVTMARNKLVSRVRSERRQIRDIRRVTAEPDALDQVADGQPSPSEICCSKRAFGTLGNVAQRRGAANHRFAQSRPWLGRSCHATRRQRTGSPDADVTRN